MEDSFRSAAAAWSNKFPAMNPHTDVNEGSAGSPLSYTSAVLISLIVAHTMPIWLVSGRISMHAHANFDHHTDFANEGIGRDVTGRGEM